MKNLLKHILHDHVKGFTLIETFVAITILMLAIAGPLSIASQGVSATRTSTNQMVALYLGQDAMEFIRWVRDSNRLQGQPGFAGQMGSACVSTTGDATCTVNTAEFVIAASDIAESCPAAPATCPALHLNESSGQYTYDAGDPVSPFTRTVSIKACTTAGDPTCNDGNEAVATVVVSWNTASGPHSITLRENLFAWE